MALLSFLRNGILVCLVMIGVVSVGGMQKVALPGLDPENSEEVCEGVQDYQLPDDVTPEYSSDLFTIETNSSHYTTGEPLSVTVKGPITFQGYSLQAVSQTEDGETPVGKFVEPSQTDRLYSCSETNNTLITWSSTGVTSQSNVWMPPSLNHGSLTFKATVFVDENNVHLGVSSDRIQKGFAEIDVSQCGIDKGCFRYPPEGETTCTHDTCQYLVTYQRRTPTAMFEISALAGWAAIGFSSDDKMGGDDVFLCSMTSGNLVDVHSYKTTLSYQKPKRDRVNRLTALEGEVSEGGRRVSCRFHRQMTIRDQGNVDLNNDWFQLYAWGSVTDTGSLSKHSIAPSSSKTKITLSVLNDVIGGAPSSSPTNNVLILIFASVLAFLCAYKDLTYTSSVTWPTT